ncbi:hypothetical protein ACHQM5_021246 [Ranunculus cassubicifolius]
MASTLFWSVDSIPAPSKCQPPRRSPPGQENVLQKKRSFKKNASQNGRGKQQYVFEAMPVEQEEVAIKIAQEAQLNAKESMDRAVRKRRRVQILMENADLATSLAAMAVKIADSAQLAEITAASKKGI